MQRSGKLCHCSVWVAVWLQRDRWTKRGAGDRVRCRPGTDLMGFWKAMRLIINVWNRVVCLLKSHLFSLAPNARLWLSWGRGVSGFSLRKIIMWWTLLAGGLTNMGAGAARMFRLATAENPQPCLFILIPILHFCWQEPFCGLLSYDLLLREIEETARITSGPYKASTPSPLFEPNFDWSPLTTGVILPKPVKSMFCTTNVHVII